MRKRLIPVLLLDADRRLVKTVRFGERTYVGDPFNVIRLFNEMEVDEICVFDIDASTSKSRADAGFLAELAAECFSPMAYGGGIDSLEMCEPLARNGVEKFVLGSNAKELPLVGRLAATFGSSSVVACVDYDAQGVCRVRNGHEVVGADIDSYCRELIAAGVGEVILQSIDRDGTRSGMDLATIKKVSARLAVPLIAVGGARDAADCALAIAAGASAAGSGSAFTFVGNLRAVLVNYPETTDVASAPASL